MRFSVPLCPACTQPAAGIWENVPATAGLNREGDVFDYDGESRMHWDGQTPEVDELGRVTLVCAAGHEWRAEMLDESVSATGDGWVSEPDV